MVFLQLNVETMQQIILDQILAELILAELMVLVLMVLVLIAAARMDLEPSRI
jgi:hypothetical protein